MDHVTSIMAKVQLHLCMLLPERGQIGEATTSLSGSVWLRRRQHSLGALVGRPGGKGHNKHAVVFLTTVVVLVCSSRSQHLVCNS